MKTFEIQIPDGKKLNFEHPTEGISAQLHAVDPAIEWAYKGGTNTLVVHVPDAVSKSQVQSVIDAHDPAQDFLEAGLTKEAENAEYLSVPKIKELEARIAALEAAK